MLALLVIVVWIAGGIIGKAIDEADSRRFYEEYFFGAEDDDDV